MNKFTKEMNKLGFLTIGIQDMDLDGMKNSKFINYNQGEIILPMITPQTFFANPIYTVGTVNLYHVGYQYLGIV